MNYSARVERLPDYVFNLVYGMKQRAAAKGISFIEFGMGNPDKPTPPHIVEAMIREAHVTANHRYSDSKGILPLRTAMSHWYERRFNVALDPESEIIVTHGSKEGLAHGALALVDERDSVLVPAPCYPIHYYGFVMAGARIDEVPLEPFDDLATRIEIAVSTAKIKPKVLILNFPSNPSGHCVDLPFLEQMVALAKRYDFKIIHDFAYADITFDGYKAPSILQVPGAKEVAIESYTLSKSYNMPGWRVGFLCGNRAIIQAISKLKSYTSYGMFAPVEYGAVAALEGPDDCLQEIRQCYQERRDWLCEGLNSIGWSVEVPRATMFVWAKIPELYQKMGSLAFCEYLLENAGVATSPGIGFGKSADQWMRFALIQNKEETLKAIAGIEQMFKRDAVPNVLKQADKVA